MATTYTTSLYIASFTSTNPPDAETRKDAVFDYIKEKTRGDSLITFDSTSKDILVRSQTGIDRIRFVTNYFKPDKITLTFFPIGSASDKPSYWCGEKVSHKRDSTLNFCNRLGDKILLRIESQDITFDRVVLGEPELNLGAMTVNLNTKSPNISMPFSEFMNEFNGGQDLGGYIGLTGIPMDVFTEEDNQNIIDKLSFLKPIFSPEYAGYYSSASNLIQGYDKTRVMLFVGKKDRIKKWHDSQKLTFSAVGISTQCVLDTTLGLAHTKPSYFGYEKTNIIHEVLTKLGKPPVTLVPRTGDPDSEGFLLLSDIEKLGVLNQKLFGVSALFREKSFQRDFVKVLDNIDYNVSEKKMLQITRENADKLLEVIKDLIPAYSKFTLIFTRRPSTETLRIILENFKNKQINIERVYFMSQKTARFVSGRNNESRDDYKYIGINITKSAAFLMPSNSIRKYWCIKPIFIENIWPENGVLTKNDLYDILWLIKKRTYRMSNLSMVTLPEPIAVINYINHLQNVQEQRVDLRFLL